MTEPGGLPGRAGHPGAVPEAAAGRRGGAEAGGQSTGLRPGPDAVAATPPAALPLPGTLREAQEILRYQGLPVLLWRSLAKGLAPVGALKLITLCEKDLTRPLTPVRARIEIDVSQATPAEIDEIVEVGVPPDRRGRSLSGQRLRFLDRRLRNFRDGSRCFVARVGREIVHSNWIYFRSGGAIEIVPGRLLEVAEDEAYMTDGFTPRPWRGKGIHGCVNHEMLRHLQEAGYRRAYTHLHRDNILSWRGLMRVGWEEVFTMVAFSIRGRDRSWTWCVRGTLDRLTRKR